MAICLLRVSRAVSARARTQSAATSASTHPAMTRVLMVVLSKGPVGIVRVRLLRDRMQHAPLLDYLAVLEPEDVAGDEPHSSWRAHGVGMQEDVGAGGEHSLHLAACI